MLTPSSERFQAIQKEAPAESQQYLVHATKYQAAQHCKVGKQATDDICSLKIWGPSMCFHHSFLMFQCSVI